MTALRIWLALLIVFAATTVAVRVLVLGGPYLDGRVITMIVAVPTVQAAVTALARRRRSPQP